MRADASPALRGVFHMTGSGEATWADFAEAVFERRAARGRRLTRVKRITTAEYPTACATVRPIRASTMKSCGASTASACRNGAQVARRVLRAAAFD